MFVLFDCYVTRFTTSIKIKNKKLIVLGPLFIKKYNPSIKWLTRFARTLQFHVYDAHCGVATETYDLSMHFGLTCAFIRTYLTFNPPD